MVMFELGADPDAVRQVGEDLRAHARELRSAHSQCTKAFGTLRQSWGGPDMERFMGEWRDSGPKLLAASERLRGLGDVLTRNADAQQRTSDSFEDGSGAPGGPGGPGDPGGPGGPGGPGSPGTPQPDAGVPRPESPPPGPNGMPPGWPESMPPREFADEHRGRTHDPFHRDLSQMAVDAYGNRHLPAGTDHREEVPPGWNRANEDQMRALGLDPNDPAFARDGDDGLQVQVFVNDKGQVVVAYRGTDFDSLPDWGTDLQQGLGQQTDHYTRAMQIAQTVNDRTNGNVIFTGHSLGGGLATAASMATGAPAVTFDAAGAHPNIANEAAGMRGGGATAESVTNQVNQENTHYYVDGDPLTQFQQSSSLAPDAQGQQVRLDGPSWGDRFRGGANEAVYQAPRMPAVAAAGTVIGGLVGGPVGAVVGAHAPAVVGFGIGFGGYAHGPDPLIEGMRRRYP